MKNPNQARAERIQAQIVKNARAEQQERQIQAKAEREEREEAQARAEYEAQKQARKGYRAIAKAIQSEVRAKRSAEELQIATKERIQAEQREERENTPKNRKLTELARGFEEEAEEVAKHEREKADRLKREAGKEMSKAKAKRAIANLRKEMTQQTTA